MQTLLKENPVYGASRLGVFYRQNAGDDATKYVYQLTDHLGNVRAVVKKQNGNTLEVGGATDYYPFGMPMPNRNIADANGYRYGYQGEFAETDPETGKPAFEARLYDPRINRWQTTDPYGQYHSPYMSMGNNWVSTVDPDGGTDNPIYGSDGKFRDCTKEGFTGEPIIFDGDVLLGYFSNYSKNDIIGLGGSFFDDTFTLSFSSQSKILTHMVNYMPKKYDEWDGLYGNGIKVTVEGWNAGYNYTARYATKDNLDIRAGSFNKYYETTVENVRLDVIQHEVNTHVFGGISGEFTDHYLAYKSLVNHANFHNTTAKYQNFTKAMYLYMSQQKGIAVDLEPEYHSILRDRDIMSVYSSWWK